MARLTPILEWKKELEKHAPEGVDSITICIERDPIACRYFVLWIENGLPQLGWIDYERATKAWDCNMFHTVACEFWESTRDKEE